MGRRTSSGFRRPPPAIHDDDELLQSDNSVWTKRVLLVFFAVCVKVLILVLSILIELRQDGCSVRGLDPLWDYHHGACYSLLGLRRGWCSGDTNRNTGNTDQRKLGTIDVWCDRCWSDCGQVSVERWKEGPVEQGPMGQSEWCPLFLFFFFLSASWDKWQMANMMAIQQSTCGSTRRCSCVCVLTSDQSDGERLANHRDLTRPIRQCSGSKGIRSQQSVEGKIVLDGDFYLTGEKKKKRDGN